MQENYPETWRAKEKHEYYRDKANALMATRHDPFTDDYPIEKFIDDLEEYMRLSNYYYAEMQKDVKITLELSETMFVTYNPKPDVTLKVAMKAVDAFCSKSKIDKYIYVIEQRGTQEDNMGSFHVHILHTHKYDRVSHYQRETQSSFNKTCLATSWNCLNMKPCKRDQDISNRLEYILGTKQDRDGHMKSEKQATDKIYRQKYKLQDYYTNDFTHWEQYR